MKELKSLQELEDQIDIDDARNAKNEPGDPVPWENLPNSDITKMKGNKPQKGDGIMGKKIIFAFVMVFIIIAVGCAGGNRLAVAESPAVADDSAMLKANEKKAWEMAIKIFPVERQLNVQQFKELYDKVMAGQEQAYLVDLRTHPEFYAAHIVGTDHIHAGHMYTFPKKIKNKDAKIVVWCRTHKRGAYVGERLAQYGYTNVWWYKDGIVGWIKAGYPLCNHFMGLFKVTEYHKYFTEIDKETNTPLYRIREFHPY